MNQLVNKLNQYLADLNVLYRKLQNFHWNVKGKQFFVLHGKLEEYYDGVNDQIDEVAEAILMLEGQPLGTMKDYLELSKIKEASNAPISGDDVMDAILEDFKYVLDSAVSIKELADNDNVYMISAMMDDIMANYMKAIWMLKQSKE